ncbi:MAG: Rubrerythrin [Candidatus Coatesbacteria bacterium]|nr:Rubrerythrin [Candidatus Coatesbacteria bacterium]
MPEFVNPFSGVVPGRKLTDSELLRAIRLTLAAEEEAVHLYESIADVTENKLAKEVLHDIANEERVHAGEFQRLINILSPDEEKFLADGAAEVNEKAAELKSGAPASSTANEKGDAVPTVGSLRD